MKQSMELQQGQHIETALELNGTESVRHIFGKGAVASVSKE